jgi:molecular chaperone DnaJ
VFRQVSVCSECGGTGRLVKEYCSLCEGRGALEEVHEVTVAIPAGVDDGHTLRLEGEGEPGDGDVTPGDLYVVVTVARHTVFERHGDDLYMQQDLGIAEATLGASKSIASLDGEVTLEVPDGTQNGAMLRLKGRGMPRLGSRHRGDLYVVARVAIPTNLSKQQKELLREFDRLEKERNRP